MKSRLKQDWANKLHMALGYRVVEDEESLKALNLCIKGIIQTAKRKSRNRKIRGK